MPYKTKKRKILLGGTIICYAILHQKAKDSVIQKQNSDILNCKKAKDSAISYYIIQSDKTKVSPILNNVLTMLYNITVLLTHCLPN